MTEAHLRSSQMQMANKSYIHSPNIFCFHQEKSVISLKKDEFEKNCRGNGHSNIYFTFFTQYIAGTVINYNCTETYFICIEIIDLP